MGHFVKQKPALANLKKQGLVPSGISDAKKKLKKKKEKEPKPE